jgi:hypothetical protein
VKFNKENQSLVDKINSKILFYGVDVHTQATATLAGDAVPETKS